MVRYSGGHSNALDDAIAAAWMCCQERRPPLLPVGIIPALVGRTAPAVVLSVAFSTARVILGLLRGVGIAVLGRG